MKRPEMEENPKQGDKSISRTSFCLRLNVLRALACISVICTHIIGYFDLRGQFRSIQYGGHMAVYFFFALSGYLLSFSLVKEVKRRVNSEKDRPEKDYEALPLQTKIDEGQESEQTENQISEKLELSARLSFELHELLALLKREKLPLVFSVLRKYLWNRTIRLFPLYYGCWALSKFFATKDVEKGTLMIGNAWKDILLLKIFPGHLWTMRIEMMFYYYVIPVFIVCLCIAFYLEKKGLKLVSTIFFSLMSCILLFVAVDKMNLKENTRHPAETKKFGDHLPPFFFGMLAALVNFALEQDFSFQESRVPRFEENLENSRRLSKIVSSLLNKYKWNIIFIVVLLRIVMLNPGVSKSLWTGSDEVPKWQAMNLNSYWYAIFILINDTRGGFWKMMRSNSEPLPALSQLPLFSKLFYYFGLWSYPIYLTHPISFVTLSHYFPGLKHSVEIVPLSIICCFLLGGLVDIVIDKVLVNKLILGKCLRLK